MPVKRWNLRKAKWSHYIALTNKFAKTLLLPDSLDMDAAYQYQDAVNISDNFSQREFAAALQHLKPGKTLGPNSICPKLILHAGAALKSWLRDFLSSCLRRLKIPEIWRRALVVAIPKPGKPVGDPKVID